MAVKNLSAIQGDTLTLGLRVSRTSGAVDLTDPDVRIYAAVTDLSGRRVVANFQIIPVDLENGSFQIYLSSSVTNRLRGKHLWSVRYEKLTNTLTLVGGEIFVGPVR